MDRFFRGFAAGLTGGIVMNLWSFIAHGLLNFSTRRFLDWSGVFLFGRLPRNTLEIGYALFIHLVLSGALGVVFALFIRDVTTSRGLLVKGVIFGLVIGFIFSSIPVMFGVQFLEFIPVGTTISNHVGGLLWGLVTAYSLGWLDRRSGKVRT